MLFRTFCCALLPVVVLSSHSIIQPLIDQALETQKAFPTGIDVIAIIDVSAPFLFKGNVAAGLKKFFDDVKEQYPNSRFRLASFSDVPIVPYGCDNYWKDHCYMDRTQWINSTEPVINKLKKLRWHYGADIHEASNMAMNFAAHTKFDANGNARLMVVVTDSSYHEHGAMEKLAPGGYFTETHNTHAGEERYESACKQCDYPCCKIIKSLKSANITVIHNQNGANGHLNCGFSKNGKASNVYEEFPEDSVMYKNMAEEKISVISLIMMDQKTPLIMWKGYSEEMAKAGGKMAVRFGGKILQSQIDAQRSGSYYRIKDAAEKVTPHKAAEVHNALTDAFDEVLFSIKPKVKMVLTNMAKGHIDPKDFELKFDAYDQANDRLYAHIRK